MNRLTCLAAALAIAGISAGAHAQSTMPAEGAMPPSQSQSGSMPYDNFANDEPYTQQDMAEVPLTRLLNHMSERGYSQYQSIRREGDVYVVQATTTDLRQVTLELDTRTGEIREMP